jgi:predicted flap endonuclease-1-like 5' DNA nuclease
MFANFACCLWWFVAGLLAGWLLWQLFDKLFRRDGEAAGVRHQRELDAANGRVQSLTSDLNGKTAEIGTLAQSLTARTNEVSSLTGDLGGLRSSVADKDGELGRLRTQVSGLTGDVSGLKGTVADRDAEIARLKAQLSGLSGDLDGLKSKLTDAEGKASASAAAALAASGVAAAASLGFKPQKNGKDDLLIIEGIGPKINELLINAGIDTFAKLAAAPVDNVQKILDAAGPNFRLANPASWAKQSDLCAKADWQALRKMQDELTAGVDKSKHNDDNH